ncbi:MAG TPA: alkaline phosphatase [Armatimonadota bacterium]
MMNYPSRRMTFSARALVAALFFLWLAVATVAAPKNVILMIGDGMGPVIVSATGAYLYGNDYHAFGGQKKLTMETLAGHYYATTYSTSGKGYDFTWQGGSKEYPKAAPTDSAASATALATGVKTYNGAIDVDGKQQPLVSIAALARQAGMKVGVITSVFFFDATPACFAAHNTGRGNAIPITHEMLMVSQPDVLMGAGNPNSAEPAKAFTNISKEDWTAVTTGQTPYQLVQDRADFQALIAKPATGKVLGLFRNTYALKACNADGKSADPTLPTLTEMTQGTLNALANPTGFFLMVEGGAIDKNAHPNNLDATIGETIAFDDAIAATLQWIAAHGGWNENLLIITADHDTGYLNSVKPTAAGQLPTAAGQLPTVVWGTEGKWGNHTNRMVDVFCMGAGSDRFAAYALTVNDFEHGLTSVVDNTAIFQVMNAALPTPTNAVK